MSCDCCGLDVGLCVCVDSSHCCSCEFYDFDNGCTLDASVTCVKEAQEIEEDYF